MFLGRCCSGTLSVVALVAVVSFYVADIVCQHLATESLSLNRNLGNLWITATLTAYRSLVTASTVTLGDFFGFSLQEVRLSSSIVQFDASVTAHGRLQKDKSLIFNFDLLKFLCISLCL